MRDSNGVSRGSGFVAFKSAEDANRAVSFICSNVFSNADLMRQTQNVFFVLI